MFFQESLFLGCVQLPHYRIQSSFSKVTSEKGIWRRSGDAECVPVIELCHPPIHPYPKSFQQQPMNKIKKWFIYQRTPTKKMVIKKFHIRQPLYVVSLAIGHLTHRCTTCVFLGKDEWPCVFRAQLRKMSFWSKTVGLYHHHTGWHRLDCRYRVLSRYRIISRLFTNEIGILNENLIVNDHDKAPLYSTSREDEANRKKKEWTKRNHRSKPDHRHLLNPQGRQIDFGYRTEKE